MASLVLTHGRYQFLETVRVPIAVLSALLFPALSMLFVSASGVADDPTSATMAVGQLAVFAILSTWVFNVGIAVSQEREQPWDTYLRTLPARPWPRIAGRLLAAIGLGVMALLPLLAIAATTTAATASPARVLATVCALLVSGVPVLFLALLIGYSMPSKAAVAVAQLTAFPLAFGGGLFLPPLLFPGWLDTISKLLPTRGGRDLVIWVLVGVPPSAVALVTLAIWTVLLGIAAAWAYQRDEGRRFR